MVCTFIESIKITIEGIENSIWKLEDMLGGISMNEDMDRVKKRVDKRLEQHANPNHSEVPFNDAMEHYRKIEGYPTKNLSKVNIQGLTLPIRILGYFFIGTMGVGMITVFLLSLFK